MATQARSSSRSRLSRLSKRPRSRWVIKAGSNMVCSGGPLLLRAWMHQVATLRREHGVVGYYVGERDCTLEERPTEEELADAGVEAEEEVPAFNSGTVALFQGSDLPAQPLAYP